MYFYYVSAEIDTYDHPMFRYWGLVVEIKGMRALSDIKQSSVMQCQTFVFYEVRTYINNTLLFLFIF